MLVESISLLVAQLNQSIHQVDGNPIDTGAVAIMGNISQTEHVDVSSDLENQLVVTLIGVEEERTLRNGPTFTKQSTESVVYHNVPLSLNLFLLFSANYRNYDTAIRRIQQVLTFFQGKNRFTPANSPGAITGIDPTADLSITMDLLSLSFEETNHLWGALGGKQLPSVAYRARLVTLRDRKFIGGGAGVGEIEVLGRDATG